MKKYATRPEKIYPELSEFKSKRVRKDKVKNYGTCELGKALLEDLEKVLGKTNPS